MAGILSRKRSPGNIARPKRMLTLMFMRRTALGWLVMCACSNAPGNGDAGNDATTMDAPSESGTDAAPDSSATDASDAASDVADAEAGVAYTYNDITSSANWTKYSPTLDPQGIQGGTFDGRYVYLAPAFGSVVTQYDTTLPFSTAGSWSNFDVSALTGAPKRFFGAAFDGTYVYLVPNASGVVVRYDTAMPFGTASSWTTFDTTTVASGATEYNGATFDGQYVYFVSSGGETIRYDTTMSFTATASWTPYSLTGAANAMHYGAMFDGQNVYYVPFGSASAVRYDTTMGFSVSGSWTTYDMSVVAASDAGVPYPFAGGAFDGRYAYFIADNDFRVVQYDTTAAFGTSGSWLAFDTVTLMGSGTYLVLGGFDGRYVYVGSYQGAIGRYDTQQAFASESSWSMYQTMTGETDALVFDGKYLYVVGDGVVARFDAKSPSSMPTLPHFSGSFY
jgi:hypothetical protein